MILFSSDYTIESFDSLGGFGSTTPSWPRDNTLIASGEFVQFDQRLPWIEMTIRAIRIYPPPRAIPENSDERPIGFCVPARAAL